MWANNLLQYREQIESDVDLVPVSFDRRNYVSVDTNMLKRMYLGLKEFSAAVMEAKHIMDTQPIDVVHVCTSASISLTKDIAILKATKKRGIRSVIHFHFGRIPQLIEKNNWEWKLVKKVASLATTMVTMDMKSYKALRGKGFDHVVYCPNPLSMAIINQIEQERASIVRIPNKLMFVGHVLPSKGVYELVEACKRLDGIELHIIGKAEEPVKSELEAIARTKDNGQWCKFRGEIPHDQVIREMLSSSLFVFPSYTEGFPNVILEAMACETPIVTTSVGAIPEMIDMATGFNNGICVKPQDADAFYEAVKSFVDDPDYAKRAAHRSLLRVHELYAVPKVWEQLVDIWKK